MSWLSWFFWSAKGSGTPADQKPHDVRDDESVDSATGIGEESGQLLDNKEIDPEIQDKLHGFDK